MTKITLKESLPVNEQETTLTFMRDEDFITLYTCDTTMITKLNKLLEASPDTYVITRQEKEGVFIKFPKKLLSFRRSLTKEKTPEQLAKAQERMKLMWEAKAKKREQKV